MEDVKRLTIQSVKESGTGTNARGPWTRYSVKTDDGYYTAFNLSLAPGETGTYKVKSEPGGLKPNSTERYINKEILGYAGPIDNYSAKPFRSSTEASPTKGPTMTLEARVSTIENAAQKAYAELLELAQVVDGLLNQLERLETPAFDAINAKADDADSPF